MQAARFTEPGKLPSERRPPLRRRGWRILLGVVGIVLAAVVAAYFFGRHQIGEFFVGKLGERLAEDGVFVDWKSADWVPGVGVRLRELALYRDVARHDRLALFDRVTARRPGAVMSFAGTGYKLLKAADTQLLLGSGATETRLEHLHLLLLLEPGKTDLRECHASLRGLRIEAKFLLADARDPETVAASKQVAQSEGLFRDVSLDWLKPVKEWLVFQPEKRRIRC